MQYTMYCTLKTGLDSSNRPTIDNQLHRVLYPRGVHSLYDRGSRPSCHPSRPSHAPLSTASRRGGGWTRRIDPLNPSDTELHYLNSMCTVKSVTDASSVTDTYDFSYIDIYWTGRQDFHYEQGVKMRPCSRTFIFRLVATVHRKLARQ